MNARNRSIVIFVQHHIEAEVSDLLLQISKGPVNIYGNTGPGNPQWDHRLFSYFFRVSKICFLLFIALKIEKA